MGKQTPLTKHVQIIVGIIENQNTKWIRGVISIFLEQKKDYCDYTHQWPFWYVCNSVLIKINLIPTALKGGKTCMIDSWRRKPIDKVALCPSNVNGFWSYNQLAIFDVFKNKIIEKGMENLFYWERKKLAILSPTYTLCWSVHD